MLVGQYLMRGGGVVIMNGTHWLVQCRSWTSGDRTRSTFVVFVHQDQQNWTPADQEIGRPAGQDPSRTADRKTMSPGDQQDRRPGDWQAIRSGDRQAQRPVDQETSSRPVDLTVDRNTRRDKCYGPPSETRVGVFWLDDQWSIVQQAGTLSLDYYGRRPYGN